MLSAVLFKSAVAKLTAAYEADNGPGSASAIPWAQIIAMIMSLLGGVCPKPPTPAAAKAQAAENPEYIDYAVRYSLIQDYGLGGWRRHNGAAISAALKKTIADADEPFLTDVLASA